MSFIHRSSSILCSLLQLAKRPDFRDHVYEGGQGGAGSCGFRFPSRPTLLEPRCDTAVSPRRSIVQLLHLYSTFYTASLPHFLLKLFTWYHMNGMVLCFDTDSARPSSWCFVYLIGGVDDLVFRVHRAPRLSKRNYLKTDSSQRALSSLLL